MCAVPRFVGDAFHVASPQAEDQSASLLERMLDMEASVNSIPALRSRLDAYKNKVCVCGGGGCVRVGGQYVVFLLSTICLECLGVPPPGPPLPAQKLSFLLWSLLSLLVLQVVDLETAASEAEAMAAVQVRGPAG